MKIDNPLVVNISPVLDLLLTESADFTMVACEDMPDCDCGHPHLIPPVELLADSEFLEESEVQELEQLSDAREAIKERIEERIEESEAAREKVQARVIEILEDCAARHLFYVAALRASMGIRLEGDDLPAELFADPETEGEAPV